MSSDVSTASRRLRRATGSRTEIPRVFIAAALELAHTGRRAALTPYTTLRTANSIATAGICMHCYVYAHSFIRHVQINNFCKYFSINKLCRNVKRLQNEFTDIRTQFVPKTISQFSTNFAIKRNNLSVGGLASRKRVNAHTTRFYLRKCALFLLRVFNDYIFLCSGLRNVFLAYIFSMDSRPKSASINSSTAHV